MNTYKGSCHCGKVAFELTANLDHVVECNCSICASRGALWHPAPPDKVKITSGEGDLSGYQFGTKTATHYFCRHCGVAPLSHPRIDPRMWVVNVRCLGDFDWSGLPVRKFDGQNWEATVTAMMAARKKP